MTHAQRLKVAGAALLLAGFTSAAAAQGTLMAKADLKDTKDKVIGNADLVQTPAGVLIRLSIKDKDFKPGERAIHIHAVGQCQPPFESAGRHFNPTQHMHGILAGPGHAGDLPNLHIPQSGELMIEFVNANVTLEKGKPNSLFDNDGSSLVIHAGADDYKSDPAGNSGDRIACGVIVESGETVGRSPAK
ncbi:MAG: superoxide dismutase, Cu-Zn family [Alphaproteobacteria bacterium]|jgi:Cu-Zn family superoxide dismutase|nr:superoxide dismutase, Cu-Zn family [Alphaproteobacteria bacterium]